MAEVTLTAAARSALLSLGQTSKLIQITQNRLASGLRVANAIDDAAAFFEAKGLSDRASDFSDKKDEIDQAISSLTTALEAVDAVDSIIRQMKGLAVAAKSATGTELADTVTQFNDLKAQ
ncbi:MAG: flagellin-like protein, partial [Gammaproteobacteria bacterium]|nr:flagellin-like protein [Gammaproteobacteria bacterium]